MNVVFTSINDDGLQLITGSVSSIQDHSFDLTGLLWSKKKSHYYKAVVHVTCSHSFSFSFSVGDIVSVLTKIDTSPIPFSVVEKENKKEYHFSVFAKSIHFANFTWTFSPPIVEKEINIIVGKINEITDFGDKIQISVVTQNAKMYITNKLFAKNSLISLLSNSENFTKGKVCVFVCGEKTLFKGNPSFSCFAIYPI